MRKIYTNPSIEVLKVEFTDCLAVSQSTSPENPIPDVIAPGDEFDFDW